MLAIGIASWQNPDMLANAVRAIQAHTVGEWNLFIIDNNSPDARVERFLRRVEAEDSRINVEYRADNIGYVGAVNRLMHWASECHAEILVYCDNDAVIGQPAWNTAMLAPLEQFHEVAMTCPLKFSAYPLVRSGYTEVLWGLGCFWAVRVTQALDVGDWDMTLGHQEEVDFQMRLRLKGWRIAGVELDVVHEAKASSSPEAQQRITQGVINWMNKWLIYFCGPNVNYFSSNVVRFENWPLNSVHIEEWFQRNGLVTEDCEQRTFNGRLYDMVKVPRTPNLYRGRSV